MTRRAFHGTLAAILVVGLAARVGYVVAQRSSDPQFARPMLDGSVYFEWGRALAGGGPGPAGAYYLAPLYPYVLAAAIKLFGENFTAIYLCQHLVVIAAAALLALHARRVGGEAAGVATAALVLLYHPILFFASRPMGESVALFGLAGAVYLGGKATRAGTLTSGLAAGLTALARPNLLLVPVAWAAILTRRVGISRAVLLVAGVAIALAPTVVRNAMVSGHLVAVSSNGGATLYHGNGPGATGVYTAQAGFSGDVGTQRAEATAIARFRSGRDLDPVEADRWFGRQAIVTRLQNPIGTVALIAKRSMLVLDNYEHSLDYAPRLDENPWRHVAPLGFAVLLGLAASGVTLSGFRGTGGWWIWGAILATAATPVAYYVSSRYRLPVAALLSVPAGIGAAGLTGTGAAASGVSGRLRALGIGAGLAALSLAIPAAGLVRAEEAAAYANRASAHLRNGDLAAAERDGLRAARTDPGSSAVRFSLGVIFEQQGRDGDAEQSYRAALRLDPGNARAAGNLAKQLVIRGVPGEAVPILRRALTAEPGNDVCWTNLVLALVALGEQDAARVAAEDAGRLGVVLDPQIIELTRGTSG